jgi:hypothetical protein
MSMLRYCRVCHAIADHEAVEYTEVLGPTVNEEFGAIQIRMFFACDAHCQDLQDQIVDELGNASTTHSLQCQAKEQTA